MIVNEVTKAQLKNYLPKSGGEINGTLVQNVSGDLYNVLKNQNRSISNMISANGVYEVYDSTNAKTILRSTKDGTTTFNGTASGNLPLSGGTVDGNILLMNKNNSNAKVLGLVNSLRNIQFTVSDSGLLGIWDDTNKKYLMQSTKDGSTTWDNALPLNGGTITGAYPLNINDNTNTNEAYVIFSASGARLGYIGVHKDHGAIFMDANWAQHKILHTGNSAKVAIQSSAPTDTSALWVW